MTVSVIVPIYNAEKYLDDFFCALEKNKFVPGDRVILADNGSSDASSEMCKEKEKEKPELYKYIVYTEKAGSYATRNYALNYADGDVLIFTDSDTKPCDEWISTIRNSIKENEVIAGRIQLEIINNTLWELYDTIVHLNSEKNAKESSIATANMAVRKNDFQKVGMFEERFSGGDYDWSHRAVQKGLKINFVEKACVLHPTRKTFEQILKKEQRIAYGDGNHQKLQKSPFVWLVIKYLLKIIKIDTNIKCSVQLKKLGVSGSKLIEFNLKFMKIRVEQMKYAIRGYKMVDARSLGIK